MAPYAANLCKINKTKKEPSPGCSILERKKSWLNIESIYVTGIYIRYQGTQYSFLLIVKNVIYNCNSTVIARKKNHKMKRDGFIPQDMIEAFFI